MIQHKQAGVPAVLGIIFIVLLLASVVILIFVLDSKGVFDKKPSNEGMIDTFVIARDSKTEQPVNAKYILEYINEKGARIILSEGNLQNTFNEIQSPIDKEFKITCWSDKYYANQVTKNITQREILQNKTVIKCDMDKIGNLTMKHRGQIDSTEDFITLNISTDYNFKKTCMCFAWTSGIIDVDLENQFAICKKGSWKNWSNYDANKRKFTYLPENHYLCGEDYLEICEYVQGTKCKTTTEPIPIRFKGQVDKCYYTGKSITGNQIFELRIKSLDYKNILDEVEIHIYDKDLRYNNLEQKWLWMSEEKGKNIAGEDFIYKINYGGCDGIYCELY